MSRTFLAEAIIEDDKVEEVGIDLGGPIEILNDFETHQVWRIKSKPVSYLLVELEQIVGNHFTVYRLQQTQPGKDWRAVYKVLCEAGLKLSSAVERHISTLNAKNAVALVDTHLIDDDYHRTIQDAAKVLTSIGKGDYVYHTQWASKKTLWYHPKGHQGVIVSPDGSWAYVE